MHVHTDVSKLRYRDNKITKVTIMNHMKFMEFNNNSF